MLQLVINGLAMGAIYALIALGLLQIFNAVRIVNFAQGQLLMLGAFLGFTTMTQFALPIWAAYLISFAAMAIIGVIFMLVAYYPLSPISTMFANNKDAAILPPTELAGSERRVFGLVSTAMWINDPSVGVF